MTDAAALVRLRLLAISAVTALVGTRVTAGQFQQSTALPAIAVEFVDDIPSSHFRGGNSLKPTRVQVTCIAETRAAAMAVASAAYGDEAGSGLANWVGDLGSPSVPVSWIKALGAREGYDPDELRQYRVQRDYMVHHR
jgi:hypothetical protein